MSTNLPDLASALSKKPPTQSRPAAPEATPKPTALDSPTEERPTPKRNRVSNQKPDVAQNAGSAWRRSIGYSMPRDVRIAATQRAQAEDSTLTAWLLNALNRNHRHLADRLNQDSASNTGDLFAVPQQQTSQPRVQSTMRVTDEQYEAMERLADELNTTRSGILTAAAEAALEAE